MSDEHGRSEQELMSDAFDDLREENTMTNESAHRLMSRYSAMAARALSREGAVNLTFRQDMKHLIEMVEKVDSRAFPEDKMQRWLGFVQAILWVYNVCPLENLKVHVKLAKNPGMGQGS